MNDAAFSQLLLQRGLVNTQQLQQLAALRQRGDPRSLPDLVVQNHLLSPGQVQQLLAELSTPGSGRLQPSLLGSDSQRYRPGVAPGSYPGSRPGSYPGTHSGSRPGSQAGPPATAADASSRLADSMRLSRLQQGDPIGLEPKLEVLCKRVLGEGGMGKVFLVEDPALGRPAALKLMKPGRSDRRTKRFRREAKVTARLDHPGIPPVYLTGQTNAGHEYLLMRFVEGKSMGEVLRELPRDTPPDDPRRRELLHALVKIGEAMSYAHSKGIVHRDLKPENVMIGAFGEVLVMDWGLARDLEESAVDDERVKELTGETMPVGQAQLTQDGAVLGTPGYLPPEQAKGVDVDARADVYSVGSMLVEVLTGEPAVVGETTVQLITKTGLGQIDLPASRDKRVAPELNAIAARSLAHKRALRYPSMEDFTRDLRAYLEGQPVSVFRYGRVQQTLRLVRRHPTLFVGLGLTFVASLLGLWAVTRARAEAAAAIQRQAADAAEGEAQTAWGELTAGAGDLNQRIGAGLKALQAAQSWRALAPDSDASAQALLQSATKLGELATAAEQWALAEQAYLQAQALDPPAIEAALAELVEARDAEEASIRREVAGLFRAAQAGELSNPDDLQEAVFTAVGHRHPVVLELAVAELDAVAAALRDVQTRAYRDVVEPTADERDEGGARLDGLLDALARFQEQGLSKALSEADSALLEAARDRIDRRLRRDPQPGIRQALELIGARQLEALGEPKLQAARLACKVIGRLKLDEPTSIGALGRYLAAECDGVRAVDGGLALCHLGTPAAQGVLVNVVSRFFGTHFRQQVEPVLARLPGEPPLEARTPRAYVRRGKVLAGKGDEEGARRDFTDAILLDAECADAYNERGNLLRGMKELEQARRDFDKAIEIEPERVGPWANRGSLRQELGDFQGALADYERATQLDPLDGRLLSNQALIRREIGDLEGAKRDLERCLELDPIFDLGWLNLGSVLLSLGERREALEATSRAIELNPSAYPMVYMLRAQIKAELGDYAGAEADFKRAEVMQTDDLPLLINRAGTRIAGGDLDGALADAERVNVLAPKVGAAWLHKAQVYLLRGQAVPARDAAMRAVKAGMPLLGRVYLARSGILAGDLPQIEELVAQLLQARPGYPKGLAVRGELRLAQGRLGEALADLDQAIELDSGDAETYRLRSRARAQAGQLELALTDLERAIELEPAHVATWIERGDLHLDAGEGVAAAADFSKALQMRPGTFRALLGRGWTRLLADEPELAAPDLEEAAALRPDDARARAGRGLVRAQLERDGARADLRRALDLGLSGPLAERVGQALEQLGD